MRHRVKVTTDESQETGYAECMDCSWGASGPLRKVDDMADAHEAEDRDELR